MLSNNDEINTMEIEERHDDDDIMIVFDKEDDDSLNFANTNIYRYKLSEEIIGALNRFAKVHQYDDRKDFKSAWTIWVDDNKELVNNETIRLNELNYDGDILEKLFVSARYYFRKKSNEKKEPQKRRSYIGVNSALIDAMDKYIVANIILKPSESFDYFCNEYVDLLQIEVTNLYKNGMYNTEAIKTKIKKN